MSKIKVGELKELNKQVVDIKEVRIFNNPDSVIEVKQYIPILDKIGFTSGIAKGCINREDGLFIVNNSSKKIAFSNAIIENYTNLTLPKVEGESGIEAFDLISRSGILDVVLENIPEKELSTLHELLENKITEERDKYNQENRLENIIKKGVDGLLYTLENLPSIEEMGNLPQELTGAFAGIVENFKKLKPEEQEYTGTLVDATIGG